MNKITVLRSISALLLLCGLTLGAIQYSQQLGAQKMAQIAREQEEALAAEEAAQALHLAKVQAAQEKLAALQEASKAAQEKYDKEHPKAPEEFVPASVYYPDTTPADIQELFDYYRANYSDVIGYIYSPYTPINYPILRGTSVDDFYLHHDINGNEDANGCIFLEHLNSQDFSDDNSILYGHHMSNGSMFASISYYKNSSYYYSHPYMYILTPWQNYRLDLWAGIVCPHDDPVFATAHSADNRQSFYNRSTFRTALGAPEGRMVTLCTCSYEANNYRYCVLGNLVPIT